MGRGLAPQVIEVSNSKLWFESYVLAHVIGSNSGTAGLTRREPSGPRSASTRDPTGRWQPGYPSTDLDRVVAGENGSGRRNDRLTSDRFEIGFQFDF